MRLICYIFLIKLKKQTHCLFFKFCNRILQEDINNSIKQNSSLKTSSFLFYYHHPKTQIHLLML